MNSYHWALGLLSTLVAVSALPSMRTCAIGSPAENLPFCDQSKTSVKLQKNHALQTCRDDVPWNSMH